MKRTTLGSNLREARHRAGLTQKQMGQLTDVSWQAIGAWERDDPKRTPKTENLRNLAKVLHVDLQTLLDLDEAPDSEPPNSQAHPALTKPLVPHHEQPSKLSADIASIPPEELILRYLYQELNSYRQPTITALREYTMWRIAHYSPVDGYSTRVLALCHFLYARSHHEENSDIVLNALDHYKVSLSYASDLDDPNLYYLILSNQAIMFRHLADITSNKRYYNDSVAALTKVIQSDGVGISSVHQKVVSFSDLAKTAWAQNDSTQFATMISEANKLMAILPADVSDSLTSLSDDFHFHLFDTKLKGQSRFGLDISFESIKTTRSSLLEDAPTINRVTADYSFAQLAMVYPSISQQAAILLLNRIRLSKKYGFARQIGNGYVVLRRLNKASLLPDFLNNDMCLIHGKGVASFLDKESAIYRCNEHNCCRDTTQI